MRDDYLSVGDSVGVVRHRLRSAAWAWDQELSEAGDPGLTLTTVVEYVSQAAAALDHLPPTRAKDHPERRQARPTSCRRRTHQVVAELTSGSPPPRPSSTRAPKSFMGLRGRGGRAPPTGREAALLPDLHTRRVHCLHEHTAATKMPPMLRPALVAHPAVSPES